MNRSDLIKTIAIALDEAGALDSQNYGFRIQHIQDVESIIDSVLDGYVIVEGEVVE